MTSCLVGAERAGIPGARTSMSDSMRRETSGASGTGRYFARIAGGMVSTPCPA